MIEARQDGTDEILARLIGNSGIVVVRKDLGPVEADLQKADKEFGAVGSPIG